MKRINITKTKISLIVSAIIVICAATGAGLYIVNTPDHYVKTTANAQHQISEISYKGESGVDALTLLKKHATVEVKHYSFGDMVQSIDGVSGNGPKYWTFYVNNKEASVGAGSYTTKNGDTLSWKLQ